MDNISTTQLNSKTPDELIKYANYPHQSPLSCIKCLKSEGALTGRSEDEWQINQAI